MSTNKLKIVNDPVYGLISIDNELIFDIIEHPLFQRQRRIKQLGLSYLVHPGAMHTRFQHALGATHLMQDALSVLGRKGFYISEEDRESAMIAILLHDLGHGPFSHTLENSFFHDVSHERISEEFMKIIDRDHNGKLAGGIKVFNDTHPQRLLHKLVSSQLDMDRLDYLNRDSFFTGVSDGVIGSARIIQMLSCHDDEPVIEAKGIYSIEKFLIARRLMYWQVYLHKTVVAAEEMLKLIMLRAKELMMKGGKELFASPALKFFLSNNITENELHTEYDGITPLQHFAELDDSDIVSAIKVWSHCDDYVLSQLCKRLIDRKLFKIEVSGNEIPDSRVQEIKDEMLRRNVVPAEYVDWFVIKGALYNKAYSRNHNDSIKVIQKDGTINEVAAASDMSNVFALSKTVKKSFVCYIQLPQTL
ncbi:MAG: HD domain-containing protein [Bacteroidales bacterium]|nr:HD domain-containing protein [Bacteroidales bacterium]MBO7567696.1 HD domain-containing protein [Bacteroidales bacterium]